MTHDDSRLSELSDDHDDLRARAEDLRRLIDEGALPTARQRLESFGAVLERHMSAEEEGIFLALEAMEDLAASVGRLRAEHERARSELVRAAGEPDDGTWAGIVRALLDGFALHETEEEYDLFPAAEAVLPLPYPVPSS